MEGLMMKTFPSILLACLLLLSVSAVQAVPIIHVTNEQLSMHSEVTLEHPPSVLNTYSASFSGSLFSGDHDISAYSDRKYISMPNDQPGWYTGVDIIITSRFRSEVSDTSAFFEAGARNYIFAWEKDYEPDPDTIATSLYDYRSVVTVDMDFYVTGGDSDIDFFLFNDGTYGPIAISLTDVTTSTQVVDLSREWAGIDETVVTLLDGHHYVLNMKVSDLMYGPNRYVDDENTGASVWFRDAKLVSVNVAEPAISLLMYVGLLGLGLSRRIRRGDLLT
jgi:hypothetical protein